MTLLVISLLLVILALSIGMIAFEQRLKKLEQDVQENDISLLTEIEKLKTVVASNRRAVRFEQSIIDQKKSDVGETLQNIHFVPGFNTASTTHVHPYYMTADPSSPGFNPDAYERSVIDEFSGKDMPEMET